MPCVWQLRIHTDFTNKQLISANTNEVLVVFLCEECIMGEKLEPSEKPGAVSLPPEKGIDIDEKYGFISRKQVREAAGTGSDQSVLPNLVIGESKAEWHAPKDNYDNKKIGLDSSGKALNFDGGYFGAREFEKYTNSANFERQGRDIESLSLAGARLSPEQLDLISKYPNLHTLNLSGNYLSNQDLVSVASNKNIKVLDLSGSAFDNQGAEVLGSMQSLESLKVDSYKLTDDFTKTIAGMPNLKSLSFDRHTDTAESLANIQQTNLTSLKPPLIFDSAEADKAAGYMSNMKNLKELNLSSTRMTDSGMEKLSQNSSIEKLNLSSSFELTGKSIDYLSRMSNLKELNLSYASKLRPSDIQRLQKALPDTIIKSDLSGQRLDVSADERRLAGTIGHDLELLSGTTSGPDYFAREVLNHFAGMPREKVNLVAQILQESPYKPIIKRDAHGNVESIAYTRSDNRISEGFKVAPIITLTVLPELLTEKAVRAYNRGRGEDVELRFSPGQVSLEARQYSDITGKGYWRGTNKVSQPVVPGVR